MVLLAALCWLKWGLDPWLKHKLTQQVARQTHGQYTLAVSDLRTELLARSLHLRGVALRPATPTLADTLPRLEARLARLDLNGVGLLALWRGTTAPIDSLTLDSLRLDVAALARRPAPARPGPPFYQQHPLRLGYLALRRVGGRLGPASAPVARLAAGTLRARDLLLTPAGAADTQRLAFAAAWQATLHQAQARLGGHAIALQSLYFSSARQLLGIDSLRITPPAPGQDKPGALQVAFTMPKARLSGLRAATWQHQHRLRADSMRLTRPQLTFKPPTKAPPPLWQLLRPLFRRADLRQVAIADGYVAIAGVREAPAVRHIFVTGRSLRLDSASEQPGARRVLYARAWAGRSGRITGTFVAPVYPVSIERAFLNTDEQVLRLTALAMRPTLTPAQLNRRVGYQATQLTVRIAGLRAQGFDYQQLSANSHLRIARVTAEQPYLLTSSDGRGPINHKPSFLTPEAARRVRAHFEVGELELRNGTLVAQFRGARTPLLGKFSINRLNATLRNVSNDPARMSLAHPLTGTATGYLQNTCRAEVRLTTSLLDPRGRQHLWGSFGPAPFSILNPTMRPTKLLSFKSGQVQGIDFDERIDRQRITGEVRARYTDLRINFLGFDKDDREVEKTLFSRVKSGLANLVVRDQNPRPSGRFVVGEIKSQRELEFSTFTAWRQGLIAGFVHSVGVPKKIATDLSQAGGSTALPPGPHAPAPASAQPSQPAQKGLLHKPVRWAKKIIRRVRKLSRRLGRAIVPD